MEEVLQEGYSKVVNIRIKKIRQLFNSFDPDPFIEKDLDHDAIDYLVGSFKALSHKSKVKIVIRMPKHEKGKFNEFEIIDAIHSYFKHEKKLEERNIEYKVSEGRKSLIIGLAFLFGCLGVRELLLKLSQTVLTHMLGEAFLIIGWVAMWKPVSNMLYDWWPLENQKKVYDKIANSEIEFAYE